MASAVTITDDDIAFELHLGCHGFQHPLSLQGTELPARHLDKEVVHVSPCLLAPPNFGTEKTIIFSPMRRGGRHITQMLGLQRISGSIFFLLLIQNSLPCHPSQVPFPQGPNHQSPVRSVQPAASVKEAAQEAAWDSTAALAPAS